GCLPGRGHLQSPAAGGQRARPARAHRRRPAERALPRPPAGGGGGVSALDFELPSPLEAHEPPEARGLRRDEVRLLVASRHDGRIVHGSFTDLPSFLGPGDLLVVNVSATLPAALSAVREDGTDVDLHLSTPDPSGEDDRWLV